MKKLGILFTSSLLAFTGVNAQRVCGSAEHLQQQLQQNPAMAEKMAGIERHTENFVQSNPNGQRLVVTIPVVVHVVYNTTAQNVSDAQIQSQINVLNADFRKLNSDVSLVPAGFASLAADCEVNFCMAQRTPAGAATTGIERRQTTVTGFSTNDAMKYFAQGGLDAWDATKYLNLWVCNMTGGILGYAQFPGGPAATDGVVIGYTCFGTTGTAAAPFNKGRTGTHEVGHWLNLRHIWGDDGTACTGSDLVTDTPNQADENYGCPSFPQVSCSNGTNGDMFMNYMDYVDDACMYMFTTGQKARMQALFAAGGSRVGLTTSNGCTPPTTASCGAPTGVAVASIANTTATVSWAAVSGATNYTVEYKTAAATTWTVSTAVTTTSKALTGLTANTAYNVRVKTTCGTTVSAYSTTANFTTTNTSTTTCTTPSGLAASAITSAGATITWGAVAGAASYRVEYKKSSVTAWTVAASAATTTTLSLTALTGATAYNVRIRTTCSGTLVSAYSTTLNFTTAIPCSSTYESNNTSATATAVTPGTTIYSQIQTATDVDFYKFSNTTTNKNIKVSLANLPADYDMTLYYPNGTTVATSQNNNTTAETIILNFSGTPTVGSYKVKVYGYGGVFSSTACYSLLAQVGATNFVRLSGELDDNSKPLFEESVISPNPTSGIATLRFNLTEEANVAINVYDQMGRLVNTQNQHIAKDNSEVEMNFSNLSNGIYFVQVVNEGIVTTHKVVVSK